MSYFVCIQVDEYQGILIVHIAVGIKQKRTGIVILENHEICEPLRKKNSTNCTADIGIKLLTLFHLAIFGCKTSLTVPNTRSLK